LSTSVNSALPLRYFQVCPSGQLGTAPHLTTRKDRQEHDTSQGFYPRIIRNSTFLVCVVQTSTQRNAAKYARASDHVEQSTASSCKITKLFQTTFH